MALNENEQGKYMDEYEGEDDLPVTKRLEEVEMDVIKPAPEERDSKTASSDLSSEAQKIAEAELAEAEKASEIAAIAEAQEAGQQDQDNEPKQDPQSQLQGTAEQNNAKDEVIDISKMVIDTVDEARRIAIIILEQLDEDLQGAQTQGWLDKLDHHVPDADTEKNRRRMWLKDHLSKLSLVSNFSELSLDLQQPSTMNLFYEKGQNKHPGRRLRALDDTLKVDESIQVDFHRVDILTSTRETQNDFTQTREFALLRRNNGKQEYLRIYQKPDDWVNPPVPSRMQSLQEMLELANQHDPEDDRVKVGPKPVYKKAAKERILKPLSIECQKAETFWTGSTFSGDFKANMFEKGQYNYPTLATYTSEFKEGHIHSEKHFGCVTYPRGDTFEGTWRKGRFTDGQITFSDGLKFEPMGWRYCTPPDRRFHIERSHGVQPVGETLYSNRVPPPHVPHGSYDVGDGIYNPETGLVISYNGVLLRKATEYEHRWIVMNCRKRRFLTECYEPTFMKERPPDSYAYFCPKNT